MPHAESCDVLDIHSLSAQAVVNEDTKGNVEALQRELEKRASVIAELRRSLQALETAVSTASHEDAAAAQRDAAAGNPASRQVVSGPNRQRT